MTIPDRTREIKQVYQQHLEPPPQAVNSNGTRPHSDIHLADQELIDKAMNSQDGAKFTALWNGEWEHLGYESASEADLALASKLNF